MKSKKNIIIGGIVLVVLIAGAVLWKGGFLGRSVGLVAPGLGIFSGKMTDEIYLEMMTQTAKITVQNYTAKDSTLSQEEILNQSKSEMSKVLDKYGISDAEFAIYSKALFEDKVRSSAMQEKLQQIMSDLLKTGGK